MERRRPGPLAQGRVLGKIRAICKNPFDILESICGNEVNADLVLQFFGGLHEDDVKWLQDRVGRFRPDAKLFSVSKA